MRRVLVVDDSAFMRRVLRDLIDDTPGFTTCAAVRDVESALEALRTLAPDIVTLDVQLPGRDGLDLLALIMREAPRPVVMVSAADSGAARDTVVRALELGAIDFVRKPSGPISLDLATVADHLRRALAAAAASRLIDRRPVLASATNTADGPRVVVVAASTGGPAALAQLVPALPDCLGAGVVIVQHMPAGFTAHFAERLARVSGRAVREATEGAVVAPDTIWVAPGDRHVRLVRAADDTLRLALSDEAPVWGVRPAADLLFASAAASVGAGSVGVVMTGMGRDGVDGLRAIAHAGGCCVIQDASTAVVDGMPGAARTEVGGTVVPLDAMAGAIVQALRAEREVTRAA